MFVVLSACQPALHEKPAFLASLCIPSRNHRVGSSPDTIVTPLVDRVPRSSSRLPACLLIDSPVSGVGSRLLVCLFVGVRSALQQSVSPSQNYVVLFGIIASRTSGHRGAVGVAYTSDTSRDSGIDTYRAVHPTAYRSVHCHLARHAGMARAGTHDNPTGIADRDGGERSRTQTGHKTSDRSGGTFIPSLQSAVPQARSLLSSSQT